MQLSSRPQDGPCYWLLHPEEPRLLWHCCVWTFFLEGGGDVLEKLHKILKAPHTYYPIIWSKGQFLFFLFFFSLLWQQHRWRPEIDLTGFCFKTKKEKEKKKKSKCWDNFTFEMCCSRTTAFYRILSWLAAKEWLVYFLSCVCVCVSECVFLRLYSEKKEGHVKGEGR